MAGMDLMEELERISIPYNVMPPPAPVAFERMKRVLESIGTYPVTRVNYIGTVRSQTRDMGGDKGYINEWISQVTGELQNIFDLDKDMNILQSWAYTGLLRMDGDNRYIWRYTQDNHSWPASVVPLSEIYRSDGTLHFVSMGYDGGETQRNWEFREDGETALSYEMFSVCMGYHRINYRPDGSTRSEMDCRLD